MSGAMTGKYNPMFSIFWLKSIHGYVDRQTISAEVEVKDRGNIAERIEELLARRAEKVAPDAIEAVAVAVAVPCGVTTPVPALSLSESEPPQIVEADEREIVKPISPPPAIKKFRVR